MNAALEVVQIEKAAFSYFADERIFGAILPTTRFTSASIGMLEPGVAQTPHQQQRPCDGVEIMFVYEGQFELVLQDSTQSFDVRQDGPIFIQVPSGVPASLNNIGSSPVRFFSVFAPPFEPGEIVYRSQDGT